MCQSEHTSPRAVAPLRDGTPESPLPHKIDEAAEAGLEYLCPNAPEACTPAETTPAKAEASEIASDAPAYVLHGVALRRVFPGIPKGLYGWAMPTRLCASLFNPWAFMLGPAYTLYKGLWAKSLFLFLISISIGYIPDVNNTGPLALFLAQSYALELYILASNHGLFLADYPTLFMYFLYFMPLVGIPLWMALLMAGYWRCAAVTGVAGAAMVYAAMLMLPPLDLGISNALPWLVARELWPVVTTLGLYAALSGLYPALASVIFVACALYILGLPIQQLDLSNFLYCFFFMLMGMMTDLDVYRRRTFKQNFWW